MPTPEPVIRDVPIPAALADEMTTVSELTEGITYCYPLTFRGHVLGHYKVVSLRADWDEEARRMRTVVDLALVGEQP
jgi:hypothetical protein